MVAHIPECPACSAPMRLSSDLASAGLSRSWVCTDTTCPTVVPEDQVQGPRGDALGDTVERLMRASVTPQGGGGSSGRSRRAPKPGEREAMQARRERRYLDQAPAGGRDRAPQEAPRPGHLQTRTTTEEEALIQGLLDAHPGLTRSALASLALVALGERAARGHVLCQQCGMPLLALDERCPACGA